MGLIIWPGDLDFWEQRQECERRRLEEARRRARLDAEWRLRQHGRQPQREEHRHDDHAHEAHRTEGLALNVGDAEQEAYAGVHAEEDTGEEDRGRVEPEPERGEEGGAEEGTGADAASPSRKLTGTGSNVHEKISHRLADGLHHSYRGRTAEQ